MRNIFRDFFRRIRVGRHRRRHGATFRYHGLEVSVPSECGLGPANSLLRDKYERDEAAMILKHLPRDLPVIELGGSLGIISRLIRSRIDPETRHIVVEANADLVEICAKNAGSGAADGRTEMVHAAIHHDGPTVSFQIGDDVHSSSIANVGSTRSVREVAATTLAVVAERLGSKQDYVLVSDIEGAEYPIFEREAEALVDVRMAIVEVHPKIYAERGWSEEKFIALARAAGLNVIDRQADVVVLTRA